MPSVKNPNGPSKNRLAARASKSRKQNQKKSEAGRTSRIQKADQKRGARTGLLPTSGPNAALSSKKKRKVERQLNNAMKRKMAAEGEVAMKDASDKKKTEENDAAADDEKMELDADNIA